MAKKRVKIWAIVLAVIITTLSCVTVAFFTGYKKYSNVSYGEKPQEVMDIFIPNNAKKNLDNGCVLFIHGGSWSGGDKKEEEFRCRHFANKGYITATLNYSVYSENAVDFNVNVILNEITSAFNKIKEVCDEQGVKISKCATSGYSAGAHLSMLYGYSRVNECPLNLKFTANLAGPSDLTFKTWGETSYQIVKMLAGVEVTSDMIENGTAELLAKEISPTTYVNENTVPSIFAYGGKDTTVSIKNGNEIKSVFEKYGVEHEYILFKNSNHPMVLDFHKRIEYYGAIADYLKKYFEY